MKRWSLHPERFCISKIQLLCLQTWKNEISPLYSTPIPHQRGIKLLSCLRQNRLLHLNTLKLCRWFFFIHIVIENRAQSLLLLLRMRAVQTTKQRKLKLVELQMISIYAAFIFRLLYNCGKYAFHLVSSFKEFYFLLLLMFLLK